MFLLLGEFFIIHNVSIESTDERLFSSGTSDETSSTVTLHW